MKSPLVVLPVLCLAVAVSTAPEPFLVAHRGASHDAPENTLPAFELAWRQGADAIEGDFRLTADGKIVCMHDADTARTAGGRKLKVAETPLAELRRLDVGRWKGEQWKGTPPPTLAEVLATVPPGKKVYLEVKCGPEIVPALARDLTDSGLAAEQFVIISFQAAVIRAVKDAALPGKAYWLSALPEAEHRPPAELVPELLRTLRDCRADGLGVKALATLGADFVRPLREAGIGFHAWTIDDPVEAARLLELGFASITTNRPGLVREGLSRW
jgi:glycerophosphoryl diester phosphodiesterase